MSGTFNIDQININITDVIPPANFATIDKNAMVGTVYTKAQDNEWRKEVEASTQSGIKSVLKPNTPYDAVTNPYPTPWVAGNSPLYEKYDVNQAGPFPNTKDVNDENINVTQNELDLNEVQIWIKNGVAQKVLKAMPQASVNVRRWEDLQSSDFPLTEGNQVVTDTGYYMVPDGKTAEATDIPGESDNWALIGSNDLIITNGSKVIQPTLLYTEQYIAYAIAGNAYGVSPNGGWKVWSVTLTDFVKFRLHASLVDNSGKLIGIKGADIVTEVFPIISENYDGEEFTITNPETEKILIASKNSGFQTYISVDESIKEKWGKDKIKEVFYNNLVSDEAVLQLPIYAANRQFPSNAPVGAAIDTYYNVDNAADIYLVPILPNKTLKITGRFGIDNGLSLLDVNKGKIHLLNVGEGYAPGVIREFTIFTNDLPIATKFISINPYKVGGLIVTQREISSLYPMSTVVDRLENLDQSVLDIQEELASGGGGGGVEIIFDKSIYLLKKGLKETNTAAQNTAIINAAILQAREERKSIYFPEGAYSHNSIDFYPVNMYGKDRNTLLINQSAGASLNMVGNSGGENITNQYTNQNGIEICQLILDAGAAGTKGLNFGSPLAFSHFERLVFRGFKDVAMHTMGMLICNFHNLDFHGCENGIRAEDGSYAGFGYMTNLNVFRDITMSTIFKKGIHWKMGASVHFENLDTEDVGALNDPTTGCIHYESIPSSYASGVGITISKSWCERANGAFWLKIDSTGSHSIRDTYVERSGATNTAVINNGGRLMIEGSHIGGFVTDVLTNGANAATFLDGTAVVGTHSETNGGQFKTALYS